MKIETKRVIWRFLLFALLGLLFEIFFTAIHHLIRGDLNMRGSTSPWMMVDYGLLGVVLMPIATPLIQYGLPLSVRAVVYMTGIFLVEFMSGWMFDLAHLHIWDYSNLPLNLYGYISLTYVPCWYILGLIVELLYRKVDTLAYVLAHGLTIERLIKVES